MASIAARIIDERNGEQPADTALQIEGRALAERLSPQAVDGCPEAGQHAERLGFGAHQVLALAEVAGMGARAGVDDRVSLAGLLHFRIVPATAQVIAAEIMRGKRHPARLRRRISFVAEVDEDLFPVRFVIVDAMERRAPVIHGIEEQVVQDEIASVPKDAAIIRPARIRTLHAGVFHLRGRGGAAGHSPAEEQRQREYAVEDARQQPDALQAIGIWQSGAFRLLQPALIVDGVQRLIHELQKEPMVLRNRPVCCQHIGSQLTLLRQQRRPALRIGHPQPALAEIPVHGAGKEHLAVGVAHDRLIKTEQFKIRHGATFVSRSANKS